MRASVFYDAGFGEACCVETEFRGIQKANCDLNEIVVDIFVDVVCVVDVSLFVVEFGCCQYVLVHGKRGDVVVGVLECVVRWFY